MRSIWENENNLPSFEPQKQEIKTDVLIIGGGLAGVLCAYELRQAGVDCCLIESERVCRGVTANTTAKITSQHGFVYAKLQRRFGDEKARLYWQANQEALERYRQLCNEIDCEFEEQDNAVYALYDPKTALDEANALQQLHIPAQYTDTLPLPLPIKGALIFKKQAQFHPLKFVAGIAKDLPIYEHTRAIAYEGDGTVLTDRGRIHASRIVVTTHFPIFNKHGCYPLKLYQHRSYVLGLERVPRLSGMYVDEDLKGLSFRWHNEVLLLGGGSHRTGKQGGNWAQLSAFARRQFPESRPVCRFATQDCMTLDDVPYIGQYSPRTPRLYVATGFNKWGMTSAMVAARLLRDQLCGQDNPYTALFSPSRTILRPQLAVNVAESVKHLLTPKRPRCPHLGCALTWNSREHSWDCPCHGSRFDENGHLLEGPATDDLT